VSKIDWKKRTYCKPESGKMKRIAVVAYASRQSTLQQFGLGAVSRWSPKALSI
jgi:hypothetical protein